jgi:hypothetical protein
MVSRQAKRKTPTRKRLSEVDAGTEHQILGKGNAF